MKKLSVISSTRHCGGSPLSSRAAATSAIIRSCSSWRLETFTLTVKPDESPILLTHSAAWVQARASTHRPICRIRPDSSAMGMNSSGGTRPRSGCCQRTRASTPTVWPVSMATTGW